MSDEEKVDNARDRIEDAIWVLMEDGWTDADILEEVNRLVEACRGDL